MQRRLSILLAILIVITVRCASRGPQHFVNAPRISHTITVSMNTDSGTQSGPTIETCVSQGAGDTIQWTTSDGSTLTFNWVVATGPKPYNVSCAGSTCNSGPFQQGNWSTDFDYKLTVGGSHPICGRIIIKP